MLHVLIRNRIVLFILFVLLTAAILLAFYIMITENSFRIPTRGVFV